MSDLSVVYKGLLESNGGDIVVKLKDGKEMKIISYLIKRRSPVFKTMMESPMQEASTRVVDLSSAYNLEAFREFMVYVYYNKLYSGSYIPVLLEILSIADYYGVEAYKTYISNRIIKLITDIPLCLMIASEVQKYGSFADNVYDACVEFSARVSILRHVNATTSIAATQRPGAALTTPQSTEVDSMTFRTSWMVRSHS